MMKSKTFSLLLFFLVLCNIFAYGEEKKPNWLLKKEPFTFGPKVSVIFSQESPTLLKKGFQPGAEIGLFFRFSPTRIYIQPELSYVIRKDNFVVDPNTSTLSYKYETHHIDIPILIGIKAIDLKQLKFRVFIGPQISFKLKDYLFKENEVQLGFQPGVGIDIWRFSFDASYSYLGYLKNPDKVSTSIFKFGVGFKCF